MLVKNAHACMHACIMCTFALGNFSADKCICTYVCLCCLHNISSQGCSFMFLNLILCFCLHCCTSRKSVSFLHPLQRLWAGGLTRISLVWCFLFSSLSCSLFFEFLSCPPPFPASSSLASPYVDLWHLWRPYRREASEWHRCQQQQTDLSDKLTEKC